jgi:iron(III) transport system substrate-binding protein
MTRNALMGGLPVRLVCIRTAVGAALAVAAQSGAGQAAEPITLYNAQHPQVVEMLTKMFTDETGIAVRVRSGEPPEIASQIAEEGERSPADVFFTANSPELVLLDEKGLLDKVPAATAARIPAKYSARDGDWIGVLARENVLAFNTAMIKESALPASLMDLAKPEWKGRVAIAPSDADFLPLVAAVATTKGEAAALDWLKGLKENAEVFDDNEGVMAAVDRGAVATGIVNNYYWARLRAENGAANMRSEIHHFAGGDVGALVNVSGAAVLKSSAHKEAAQRFLAFLVSEPAQHALAESEIAYEYPLVPGIAANPLLKPLDRLQPPELDPADLGDDQRAAQLLRQAGLI